MNPTATATECKEDESTITVRIVHYSTIDFKPEENKKKIGAFFKLFDKCHVKYSTTTITKPEEIRDDIILQGDISCSDKRRTAAAKDLIEALCDDETNVIWLWAGGNPNDMSKGEEILARFVYEIHTNSAYLHNIDDFMAKPMIGYCYVTPVLLYLSQRGLVKAIHGDLCDNIQFISQNKASQELYRNIIKSDYNKCCFTNLKPNNQAAINMITNGSEINGIIMGGLVQIIRSELDVATQIEEKIGLNMIKNKPIILFLEAIATGSELQIAKEIFELVIKHGIQIKALGIGYIHDYAKVEKYLSEVSAAANGLNIPVVSGLKIGHGQYQEPVLMSHATLKYDTTCNSLIVSYEQNKKTIGLINSRNAKAESLWNENELRTNGIECRNYGKNVSEVMCVVL
eukprot:383314_1